MTIPEVEEAGVSGDRVSVERLREILAGCKDVTPGPWRRAVGAANYRVYGKFGAPIEVLQVRHHTRAGDVLVEAQGRANAAHIARLDPATVASIITELLALRTKESSNDQ